MPASSGLLTLIFLYFYYFIGSTMEREWGQAKFNLYFLSGMLFTIIYSFVVYFATGKSPDPYSVAEYIYLSMFFTFATYYPDVQVLLFFVIPVKIKWLAWVDAAFFLYSVFRLPFPNSLLPIVAVLNYLLFCGDILFANLSPSLLQLRDLLRRDHGGVLDVKAGHEAVVIAAPVEPGAPQGEHHRQRGERRERKTALGVAGDRDRRRIQQRGKPRDHDHRLGAGPAAQKRHHA